MDCASCSSGAHRRAFGVGAKTTGPSGRETVKGAGVVTSRTTSLCRTTSATAGHAKMVLSSSTAAAAAINL